MLYITDSEGNRATSVDLTVQETASTPGAIVDISARVYEDDLNLVGRWVTGTINWNDGSGAAVSLGKVSINTLPDGFWTITASKRLQPGKYVIVLNVQNFRAPTENRVRLNFFVTVVPNRTRSNPPNLIYGPLLPRDSGFPNNQQWEFQVDSDILVLESSVKMLLLTAKNDRIMEPSYGTNIRRILFDLNLASVESSLREEIVDAFARWEPRVDLGEFKIERNPNSRSVTVHLILVSRLNRQPFQTQIEFAR